MYYDDDKPCYRDLHEQVFAVTVTTTTYKHYLVQALDADEAFEKLEDDIFDDENPLEPSVEVTTDPEIEVRGPDDDQFLIDNLIEQSRM